MKEVERNSQFAHALRELRQLILNGTFEANGRLSETAIAERLGISRTPLRQAMDRLVDEGLVDRIETGGCRVSSFTITDIEDAIEIRGVIEGTAVRLAAERGVEPEAEIECEATLTALDATVSGETVAFDRYVRLNAKFHQLLAGLAGSQIVAREVERVSKLPLASPSAFLRGQELIPDFQASLKLAQTQHRAIFDAILNRQGTRAEALAREHAGLARQNLQYVMESRSKLVRKVPGLALVSNG